MSKDYSIYNIVNEGRGELFHRQQIADNLDEKSEFIVEDGYIAFLVKDGTRQETIKPGRHVIFNQTAGLFGRKKTEGLAGGFDKKRSGVLNIVYVSNNSAKKAIKWGIPSAEMEMRDPLTKVDFMMSAFGEMTVKVAYPEKFYEEWLTDKAEGFSVDDFQALALSKIKEKVKSAIIQTIRWHMIPYHEIDENTEKIAKGVLDIIKENFSAHFGINVTDFVITKIAIPDDKKREIRGKYDGDQAEIKAKEKKQEAKDDAKDAIAEAERLTDKAWEREKYLLELKSRDYEKYLRVSQEIGWETGAEKKAKQGGGFCAKCGNPYAEGSVFCPKCGKKVAPDKCECGNLLAVDSVFCSKCGKAVK